MSDVEAAKTMHVQSVRDGSGGLMTKPNPPEYTGSSSFGQRMMSLGGRLESAIPTNGAELTNDNQPKADDGEYEFVEHPEPRSIHKFRQVPAIARSLPDGAKHAVSIYFDNCADSNFISSNIVTLFGFHQRPLLAKDIVTYNGLTGDCRPVMYVPLELHHREVREPYKESFRVVQNGNFELIVGAATIEHRNIQLQEQTERSAFPSFKKQPTKGEVLGIS